MNQQPKYRIYVTLLDAFGAYLNSDVIWDKYWGVVRKSTPYS